MEAQTADRAAYNDGLMIPQLTYPGSAQTRYFYSQVGWGWMKKRVDWMDKGCAKGIDFVKACILLFNYEFQYRYLSFTERVSQN